MCVLSSLVSPNFIISSSLLFYPLLSSLLYFPRSSSLLFSPLYSFTIFSLSSPVPPLPLSFLLLSPFSIQLALLSWLILSPILLWTLSSLYSVLDSTRLCHPCMSPLQTPALLCTLNLTPFLHPLLSRSILVFFLLLSSIPCLLYACMLLYSQR